MSKTFLIIGALSAFLAVGAGAFGAHGLQAYFEQKYEPQRAEKMMDIWETGARYQMYHALALLAVAWACSRFSGNLAPAAGWCFVAGTVLFSGSLYVLSTTDIRWLGAITPLGGLAFMVGWLLLALAAWKGE